jgi:hypothetical protein
LQIFNFIIDMEKNDNKQENTGKKWLLIAIVIILLCINGIQLYLQNNSKIQITEQKTIIIDKEAEIKIYGYKLDSIKSELLARYQELAKIGGDTTEMVRLIRELKSQKSSLQKSKDNISALYANLKRDYDAKLSEQDKEIENIRTERDLLFKENNNLKKSQQSLSDSLSQLKYKKDELTKQVEQAAILKATNVKITFIRKGKEYDEPNYKAKKVEKLKITFDILENKVAKIENKAFYIRVIEPDGAALYDLATGGGSFVVDGKNVYYTAKQELLYDRNASNISFVYSKGSAYKIGTNLIEVYCEGQLIGKGVFILK